MAATKPSTRQAVTAVADSSDVSEASGSAVGDGANDSSIPTKEVVGIQMVVRGKVQGVFFRASTLEVAQSLGLVGWVRNLATGEVEIEAEGPKQNLEDLIAWCHDGPTEAVVEDVSVRWVGAQSEYRTFRIDSTRP